VAESFFRSLGKSLVELEEEDVEICLQMAVLVNSPSTRQNTLLAGFLNLFFEKLHKVTTSHNRLWEKKLQVWTCPHCRCKDCIIRRNKTRFPPEEQVVMLLPIPRTVNQLRSVILNGCNSFTSMLPIPKIRLHAHHAYVLPSECIKIYLANGHLPMEFTATSVPQCYAMLRDTPRGVDIASELTKTTGDSDLKHYPISFIEWKDDCEPSKSNKKSKKGVSGYGL
jgi:hypothetical protein